MTPIYVVDIIGEVVSAADAALRADATSWLATNDKHITYKYGDREEIITRMQQLTNATYPKYPFIGLVMPFQESRGASVGYYENVTFKEIIIATVSNKTDDFPARYTKWFKPVLYPIYYEFLNQLARHKNNPGSAEVDTIPHTKQDVPNIVPTDSKLNDYVDAIVITNLQVRFKQYCN